MITFIKVKGQYCRSWGFRLIGGMDEGLVLKIDKVTNIIIVITNIIIIILILIIIIIIVIIIIIIVSRPKPAFGRLGLGGSLGVKTLGEGKISKNVTHIHTDTSQLYIYQQHQNHRHYYHQLLFLIITCFLDWSVETCLEQALGGGLLDLREVRVLPYV